MARWRLLVPHYLNTEPSAEVEFKEVDRNTGRQARKVYKVPRYLDPKDPSDHNYPSDGDIVVSNGTNAQPRDIIFYGDPTIDMEPIDEEAKAINKSFIDSGRWTKKEEGLDFGESLIKNFMAKMDNIQFQAVSAGGVDPNKFAALQEQVAELMKQNADLRKVTSIRRT